MTLVVSAVSKVRNLKAIHNRRDKTILFSEVVSAVSKVRNLKAIHNTQGAASAEARVVSAVSKVRNLKAIHNADQSPHTDNGLRYVYPSLDEYTNVKL